MLNNVPLVKWVCTCSKKLLESNTPFHIVLLLQRSMIRGIVGHGLGLLSRHSRSVGWFLYQRRGGEHGSISAQLGLGEQTCQFAQCMEKKRCMAIYSGTSAMVIRIRNWETEEYCILPCSSPRLKEVKTGFQQDLECITADPAN